MPLTRWKLLLQKVKPTRNALELMTLSGAVRRADVEIRYRPSSLTQSIARHTPGHTSRFPQDRV